jgi:hypothetical protein
MSSAFGPEACAFTAQPQPVHVAMLSRGCKDQNRGALAFLLTKGYFPRIITSGEYRVLPRNASTLLAFLLYIPGKMPFSLRAV